MCFFCLFVFCNFLSNNLTITNFPCSNLLFFFLKPFPLPEDGNKTLITFGCYLPFLPLLPPLPLPLSKPALRFQLFMDWERHITGRGSKSDCRNPDSLEFIGSITSWSRARQLGCAAPEVWMHGSPARAKRAPQQGTRRHRAGLAAAAAQGEGGKGKQQHLAASNQLPLTGEKANFFFIKQSKLLIFPIHSLIFANPYQKFSLLKYHHTEPIDYSTSSEIL